MKIEQIAEEIGFVWIHDGDQYYIIDTRRGGGEVQFGSLKEASDYVREQMRTGRAKALKERKRRLARFHDEEFATYLNGVIGINND